MKQILLLACALLISANILADPIEPDNTGMKLNAQEWTRNVKMGWNLGNSLESSGSETAWGNPKTTKEMIHAVKEAGFNAIRIPVRWGDYLKDETTMEVKAEWLKRVKEVVDWCLDEDMYVIINTHHEEWLEQDPSSSNKSTRNNKLAALWTNIATYFRDYGEKLAFAGTNEVRRKDWGTPTSDQQSVQNSFNQTFINTVRETGGKNAYRVLIVQTFACSPYHGLSGFTIPEDKVEGKMCVEFHYYDPYGYGLLTGNSANDYYYWGEAYKEKAAAKGKKVPSDNETTQKNLFDRIQKAWGNKGLGIVIGEYGVTNHYTTDDKETQLENMQYYMKTTVSNARERGFATFVWDNNVFGNGNEKFGIFKRNQNMEVGTPHLLKGICEGAGTEYKEPEQKEQEKIEGGEVFWEGDSKMDWGDGLQLQVPAEEFAKYNKDVRLVLSYTLDYTDYNMIQFFYGDWKANPSFYVDGAAYTKEFTPSNIYSAGNDESCTSIITFDEDVYNEMLNKQGLAIQGHGLRLNKVVLAHPATGIKNLISDSNSSSYAIYNLQGQRVDNPKKGIFIKAGKKVVF